jgi:hypothetical protein
MLSGFTPTSSAFVPGRPAHQWMAVKTKGEITLNDLGRRVRVAPEFAEKVYDIVSPGTTIVVTDAPALVTPPSNRAIRLMDAREK